MNHEHTFEITSKDLVELIKSGELVIYGNDEKITLTFNPY